MFSKRPKTNSDHWKFCFRQPASAFPASFSHADDAVSDEKRDPSDDVAGRVAESALPPQAVICNKSSALYSRASIFLTLVIFLLAGISMPAAAKVLVPCATGLVNDGFRHRDLHTATFLTRDPAGFIDGPNTYNYVGHNPWSAFDPHGLASTIPVTSGEIGYVGEPSVTANDPPMISYGPNRDSGTAGSQHPYGYSPGGGPGVTVDPVSDAVGSQPSSLMDNALDAYAWVREISRGYSFGYDYLGGVMGAGYPVDSPTRTPTRAQQRELAERDNSPAYRLGDLFAGMVDLPGKAGAFAINTITMADITSAPLEYDVSRGFYLGENSPHVQLATAGILFLGGPIGRGGSAAVDDALRAGMRSRSFAPMTGVKLLPEFAGSSIDDVIVSSTRLKGQMAEGARGIAKKLGHAERGGYTSAFDGIKPTQANAERIIRETLSNPSRSFYGDKVIDVYNSAGQGIRIDRQTNKFLGFLEDSLSTQ